MTTLPFLVAIDLVKSGDIKDLVYHVTSQNQLIERLCTFMSGSSSSYVTTLASLAAIGSVVVER